MSLSPLVSAGRRSIAHFADSGILPLLRRPADLLAEAGEQVFHVIGGVLSLGVLFQQSQRLATNPSRPRLPIIGFQPGLLARPATQQQAAFLQVQVTPL